MLEKIVSRISVPNRTKFQKVINVLKDDVRNKKIICVPVHIKVSEKWFDDLISVPPLLQAVFDDQPNIKSTTHYKRIDTINNQVSGVSCYFRKGEISIEYLLTSQKETIIHNTYSLEIDEVGIRILNNNEIIDERKKKSKSGRTLINSITYRSMYEKFISYII